jgi:hypothetical protein
MTSIQVCDMPLGRLGNAIFRYLSSTVFMLIYGGNRVYNIRYDDGNKIYDGDKVYHTDYNGTNFNNTNYGNNRVYDTNCGGKSVNKNFVVRSVYDVKFLHDNLYNKKYQDTDVIILDDVFYLDWKKNVLNNNIKPIKLKKYLFFGYFQHDDILTSYKNELIEHMRNNQNDLLITDGNNDNITEYNYPVTTYRVKDILTTDKQFNKYDIVFHLRLEDFITHNIVMNPNSLIKLLDNHKRDKICFVVNQFTTILEKKYIAFFTKKYNIVIESNDVIQDFHIMKNAKILCCSCSTLSWLAAFFSETVELVYFPNYDNTRLHETFKKPIDDTVLYEFSNCSIEELDKILYE